jgi:hypothetical protein
MGTHHTPPAEPGQRRRAILNVLGAQRLRRRARNDGGDASIDPLAKRKLLPAEVLGYFVETIPFQVEYGSERSLWIKAARQTGGRYLAEWNDFQLLDRDGYFEPFALVDWHNDQTTFAYNGNEMEPEFMPLHSPTEAIIQFKALVLYWHFTRGSAIHYSDEVIPNPSPAYVDPRERV